jgi:hypothetical protein
VTFKIIEQGIFVLSELAYLNKNKVLRICLFRGFDFIAINRIIYIRIILVNFFIFKTLKFRSSISY